MQLLLYKKIFSLIIILSAINFLGCTKADFVSKHSSDAIVLETAITGRVTDLNNVPVSDAIVAAGALTTTTDVNGQFIFKNAQLFKDAVFIKVIKPGYFVGSRTLLVDDNEVNNVKIELIPKTVSGYFPASAGGHINIPNGGSVSFSSNSMVTIITGASYTGNVSVSAFYLNPITANFNEYMPGDLRGINTSNVEETLQSFGMVLIELNDDSGEKLQLAPGKSAIIILPIPDAMKANAPATIPLWYFDETKGLWKEEGSAAMHGNNYVGSVSHFSFWNCDMPIKSVKLSITCSDKMGNPLSDKLVTVNSIDNGTRSGYTNNKGTVCGLVPADEVLQMKVFNQCGDVINTKSIGPFNVVTHLDNILTAYDTNDDITLYGTAVDCTNINITNGYAQVNIGDNYVNVPITNGKFKITINRCTNANDNATLVAYDVANAKQSIVQKINFISNSQDIGQLKVCSDILWY